MCRYRWRALAFALANKCGLPIRKTERPLRAVRRFSRQNQRQEPYAPMPHIRVCAGAVANHRLQRDRLLLPDSHRRNSRQTRIAL
ncbi:hypothetical protein D3C84_466840 [compost metagenome]